MRGIGGAELSSSGAACAKNFIAEPRLLRYVGFGGAELPVFFWWSAAIAEQRLLGCVGLVERSSQWFGGADLSSSGAACAKHFIAEQRLLRYECFGGAELLDVLWWSAVFTAQRRLRCVGLVEQSIR